MELAEFFEQGGPLMWVILGASIVGVAVFLERLWSLQRTRVVPRAFVDRIRAMVSRGKTSESLLLCEENGSSIAMLMAAALRAYEQNKNRAEIKESVEEVGNREVAHLDRNVEIVGTMASITPLMGLLGTVIGMIQVFQGFVETYPQVRPDAFAQGIWQALITTAAGLAVAIPMLVAYKFLQGRNDRLVVAMEEDAMGIVDLLEDAQRVEARQSSGRMRAKRSRGDVRRSRDDARRSRDDVRRSRDDVRRSRDDDEHREEVRRSRDDDDREHDEFDDDRNDDNRDDDLDDPGHEDADR